MDEHKTGRWGKYLDIKKKIRQIATRAKRKIRNAER